jgi:hypothetical protein
MELNPTHDKAAEGGHSDGMKSKYTLPPRDYNSDASLESQSFWLTTMKQMTL